MATVDEQRQELADLRRMDELEAKLAQKAPEAPIGGLETLLRGAKNFGNMIMPGAAATSDRAAAQLATGGGAEGQVQYTNPMMASPGEGADESSPEFQGALQKEQGRQEQFSKESPAISAGSTLAGFLAGGGAQIVRGAMNLGKRGLTAVGAKLANVEPKIAAQYAANPKAADTAYQAYQKNPLGHQEDVRETLRNATSGPESVFAKSSEPLIAARNEAVIGKNIQVDQEAITDPTVRAELDRMISEQFVPKVTPNPTEIISNSGAKLGGETLTLPPKVPKNVTLTAAQAQRLKDVAGKAAQFNRSATPIGYNPANDAAAATESSLRKALEAASPVVAPINAELALNARHAKGAQRSLQSNPSKILTTSESLGSTPTRAARQLLDEKAGAGLGEAAKQLEAGKAVNEYQKGLGLTDRLLARPTGRAILKRVGTPKPQEGPKVDPRLLINLFGNK